MYNTFTAVLILCFFFIPKILPQSLHADTIKAAPVLNNSGKADTSGFIMGTYNYINRHIETYNKYFNDIGITYLINYKGDFLSNLAGGNYAKSSYLKYLYAGINFNLDKIFNYNETKLYISSIGVGGESFCSSTGASQGISNIEAFNTWKIYELWIEHNFIDEHLSLKLGLYDLNTEFDSKITSSVFINPSHGIGLDFSQSGKNGPSIFPTTSLTFRIKYKSESNFLLQTAILDGLPGDPDNPNGTHIIWNKDEGFLFTAETGFAKDEENFCKGYEKYIIGGWYYNSTFPGISSDDTNPELHKGNFGIYASAEKFLFSPGYDSACGLAAFLRIGYAESNINRFNSYLGTGIIYKGLFCTRDEDIAGLAVAIAGYSYKFKQASGLLLYNLSGPEINLEFTYSIQLADWFNVQPDFQYIINPTYCTSGRYAFVAGLRTSLVF
jgi:porin